MNNNQEIKNRIEYLNSQIVIKKQQVEKLLQEMKNICTELIQLKETYNQPKEINQ